MVNDFGRDKSMLAQIQKQNYNYTRERKQR